MTAAVSLSPADLAAAAELLEQSLDYRVLRRFYARSRYTDETWNLGDPPTVRLGLYVDCETTGLDRELDEIIEFAAVPFTYDARAGVVFEVLEPLSFFEEPKRPIADEITAITGITPAMVAGKRIDDARVLQLVERAGIVVAHNAQFDRPMLERRLPKFAHVHWACSQREVPWERFGCVGAKLENVLAGACGEFYDAHRATDDCLVGVHCLAAAQYEGRTALSYLLASAREQSVRVWAINTPYGSNEKLKAHRPRYRWSDGSKLRKGWYTDVKPAEAEREQAWLLSDVYGYATAPIALERLTSRDRYSNRIAT